LRAGWSRARISFIRCDFSTFRQPGISDAGRRHGRHGIGRQRTRRCSLDFYHARQRDGRRTREGRTLRSSTSSRPFENCRRPRSRCSPSRSDAALTIITFNFGDYLIAAQLSFERQTAEDLGRSITDSRLFRQVSILGYCVGSTHPIEQPSFTPIMASATDHPRPSPCCAC